MTRGHTKGWQIWTFWGGGGSRGWKRGWKGAVMKNRLSFVGRTISKRWNSYIFKELLLPIAIATGGRMAERLGRWIGKETSCLGMLVCYVMFGRFLGFAIFTLVEAGRRTLTSRKPPFARVRNFFQNIGYPNIEQSKITCQWCCSAGNEECDVEPTPFHAGLRLF